MRTPWKVAAAVAVVVLGGCTPVPVEGGPGAVPVATVQVNNQNWADMNVFVVQNGMRMRLGTVTSMQTATFRIPGMRARNVASLRVVADPIGSSAAYTSESIQVHPGQQVALTVQNALQMSSVAIWDR